MASRHRHQSSLEDVIDFDQMQCLEAGQRAHAINRFYQIIDHFKAIQGTKPYSRPLLIQYTYEYARSEISKDNILRVFFGSLGMSMDSTDSIVYDAIQDDFNDFADYLMSNFFLPMRTSGGKTQQPTPKVDSAMERLRSPHLEVGTPDRMSTLRETCLTRDRHRCVVSRAFDSSEFDKRVERYGEAAACDDDGILLSTESKWDLLDVAHIIPHSLTKAENESQPELAEARKTTLNILNMFDVGIVQLVEGIDIDRPRNALSLTHQAHSYFGRFLIFFEEAPPSSPGAHTYTIRSFKSPPSRIFNLPLTRTLYASDNIDPPSRRLFSLHRAIAHILHLSGAGEYISKLIRDMEETVVRSDGSSDLAEMVSLRLGGWWDGTVHG